AVTALMSLYVWAGFAASRTKKVAIKLERGYSAQARVFRLGDDRLRMRLIFRGDHTRRPELGTSSTRSDWRGTGTLKFENPGTVVRIPASAPGLRPVTYEALQTGGHGSGVVIGNLTASLSIAPGVWQWPPAANELVLHRGTNLVDIEVVSVEPPLVG